MTETNHCGSGRRIAERSLLGRRCPEAGQGGIREGPSLLRKGPPTSGRRREGRARDERRRRDRRHAGRRPAPSRRQPDDRRAGGALPRPTVSTLTMPARISHDELLRRKRELRLRIGRSRRRIDRRLRATRDRAGELLSWRTYVVRYPAWALAAALGAGLAASAGFRPARISRWLGLSLVRHAMGGVQQRLWAELRADLERCTPT